jgi:ring-1,2-phenylacetyl-CoA epoxidase subunit PaaC
MTAPDAAIYALRLGDDALVLAQRLSEWSARAPELEEDLALTNIALDLLGQARALLTRAGELEGLGRDEDDLAYLRGEREFSSALIVEQPNGDFARTIARQLVFSTYQLALYDRLCDSADPVIAGVAAKAVKEVAYHRDHAREWTLRLGDGTAESHRRMQEGIDWMWPLAAELFEHDELTERLVAQGIAADARELRPGWEHYVGAVLDEATLARPDTTYAPSGGRRGEHTEALGHLLAVMQSTHRAHPGATW